MGWTYPRSKWIFTGTKCPNWRFVKYFEYYIEDRVKDDGRD